MKTFLKGEWRKLIMANYVIDPKILEPLLPLHTELDLWEGKCYISLVGFLFMNTKVRGFKVPYHINFEEVNLRFYVKHFDGDEWKRGVVFIKELVPKRALAIVAKTIYGEPYEALPMSHKFAEAENEISVEYSWMKNRESNSMSVTCESEPQLLMENSEEEFITEHFWGYTKRRRGFTSEYEVAHPRWVIYPVKSYEIKVDYERNYGSRFALLQDMEPQSVFLAEGSEIVVKKGKAVLRNVEF